LIIIDLHLRAFQDMYSAISYTRLRKAQWLFLQGPSTKDRFGSIQKLWRWTWKLE